MKDFNREQQNQQKHSTAMTTVANNNNQLSYLQPSALPGHLATGYHKQVPNNDSFLQDHQLGETVADSHKISNQMLPPPHSENVKSKVERKRKTSHETDSTAKKVRRERATGRERNRVQKNNKAYDVLR